MAVLVLVGCASVEPVSPQVPSITLETQVSRNLVNWPLRVVFPAGVYKPSFRTDRGIYYQAPTVVIFGKSTVVGGLFVPTSPIDKQVLWTGDEGSHRYDFNEPVPYR